MACVCVCACAHCVRTYLSCEGDGAGLALGADACWPGWVAGTAWLDLAAEVLQGGKLTSGVCEKRGNMSSQLTTFNEFTLSS